MGLRYLLSLYLPVVDEESHEIHMHGNQVFGPGFEPGTSQIRCKNAGAYATFGSHTNDTLGPQPVNIFRLIRQTKVYAHTKHPQKTSLKICVARNVLLNVTSCLPVYIHADVSMEPAQYVPYDSTRSHRLKLSICSKLKVATTIVASLWLRWTGRCSPHYRTALRYHTERCK
jgi:hypothetical protein